MAAKEDSRLQEIEADAERTARIAELNDQLRCKGEGGTLAVTDGVITLAQGTLPVILRRVILFDEFTPDNDPHGEHDFGAIEWQGVKLFWKIDCYDRDLRYGSPDPTDPSVTSRVLTVLLASEW